MKKILLILTALALAVSLCGCGLQEMLGDFLNDYLETEPTAPEQELNSILETLDDIKGGISLSVHTDDGDVYGPYELDRLPELDTAMGRPVEQPTGLGRYDNWLVLTAGDGDALLTVYVGNRDMVCLEEDGNREFYRDESSSLARPLRRIFDTLEYEATEVRVMPPLPGAAVALREFASAVYPELRKNLAPGSIYGFKDYDLFDYDVVESTNTTLTGTIVYAALPDALDSPILEQGELMEDEGYEGYVLITETVHLEHREDGFWYRTDPIQ